MHLIHQAGICRELGREFFDSAHTALSEVMQVCGEGGAVKLRIDALLEQCSLALAQDDGEQFKRLMARIDAAVVSTEQQFEPTDSVFWPWISDMEDMGVESGLVLRYDRHRVQISELRGKLPRT